MPYFAMRHVDSLPTPSVVRWGTQDFEATDPTFDPMIHDQVPLRSDVSEVEGVPTRHHTTQIVPPDVTNHTLVEMLQAEKDAVDGVIEPRFKSFLEYAVSPGEIVLTQNSYQVLGSVCVNLRRFLNDPGILRATVSFTYIADGQIRFRFRAQGNAGEIDLGGGTNFPAAVAFDRVRTNRSQPLPSNNGVLEYQVQARVQPAGGGTTSTIRGITLHMIEEN